MSTKRVTAGVYSRKRPLGPNGERICYNCGGPLPKGKPFNCSHECSEQWRAKTSPSYMRYLLHKRDKGVCALCGLNTDALQAEYKALRDNWKGALRDNWKGEGFRLYNAKHDEWLKAHGIPPSRAIGDWWDADHINPVIEGGGECGLENFRTLCIPCHKKVTAELRRRLANRERERKAAERFAEARKLGWNAPDPAIAPVADAPPSAEAESLFD